MQQGKLYIKEVAGKGRGVFSNVPLQAGELVENCKMLVLKAEEYELSTTSFLINFSFYIDRDLGIVGIATGFGSLYNHAAPANAMHKINKENSSVDIVALQHIDADEEICINYHGDFDDDSTAWFDNRGIVHHP